MPSIIFRLGHYSNKELDPNKTHSIYLNYKHGKDFQYRTSTKIKIKPKFWDAKKQSIKNNSEFVEREIVINKLNEIRENLIKIESSYKAKGITLTKDIIKKEFQNNFKKPDAKPLSLFEYIRYHLNKPETKDNLKKGTLKTYHLTETYLKRFSNEVYPIDFDNIDMDFYNDFKEWSENQNLSINYIGKHIKTLKTFLVKATNDKVNFNIDYLNSDFKILKEDAENIYLNLEELKRIYDIDLSHLPKLDQARDLFLIGAHTGLRISDFNNLTSDNIIKDNGKNFLKVKTQKTGKMVVIPLRAEVEAIFKKHGNKPPKRMPDQHINYKIKDVCQNAGIDEIVFIEQTKGGKKVRIKKYKYDLVKSHTARRSFCTNAYLSGMNTLDIMQISTHTSEKTFLNYIKADALDKAKKISEHPFFNAPYLKSV